jgi:iron complex outermembrane recepter protein
VPPFKTRQLGLFTLQEFKFGNVELEASARYDRNSLTATSRDEDGVVASIVERDFNNFSGALGLSYTAGQLKLGVNVSRTGRAPAAEELFSNGPHIATQAFEIGDPTLRSERAFNGELYTRYEDERVGFAATLYANRFDNFIYEVETGEEEDGLPVFQYLQNDADIWGIELEANARLANIGGFNVDVNGVADYTRAKISNGGGNIPRIPPLRLLGGVALKSSSFDLRGEVEWTDNQANNAPFETATEGFTFVNATATWRPFGRDKNIALIASANNIFDVEGRRTASFTKDFVPLAGRDFRLAARFSF